MPYSDGIIFNIFSVNSLMPCLMSWWRAPGSWLRQHQRKSTSGGGCRANSLRKCIYSEPEILEALHVLLWSWNELFFCLLLQRIFLEIHEICHPILWPVHVQKNSFSVMCLDAIPCDCDFVWNWNITHRVLVCICSSGGRYFILNAPIFWHKRPVYIFS